MYINFKEMIFVQPFLNNFLTIFSHTHIIFLFSLFFFLSLLFLIKEEKTKVVMKVVPKSCTNITTLNFKK